MLRIHDQSANMIKTAASMTPVLIQQKGTEVRAAAGSHNAECTGLFLIPVKLVQHAVQYRRENQARGNQEHQTCIQRVQARE